MFGLWVVLWQLDRRCVDCAVQSDGCEVGPKGDTSAIHIAALWLLEALVGRLLRQVNACSMMVYGHNKDQVLLCSLMIITSCVCLKQDKDSLLMQQRKRGVNLVGGGSTWLGEGIAGEYVGMLLSINSVLGVLGVLNAVSQLRSNICILLLQCI